MIYVSTTPELVQQMLVDAVTALSGLAAGRVLIETKNDARPSNGLYATIWFKDIQL